MARGRHQYRYAVTECGNGKRFVCGGDSLEEVAEKLLEKTGQEPLRTGGDIEEFDLGADLDTEGALEF